MLFFFCWFFFQNQAIWKTISGISSECQTVWIQIRPNIFQSWSGSTLECKEFSTPDNILRKSKKRIFKFLERISHLFHRVKRKMHISWVAKPQMKYTFSRFTGWNKWHKHSKYLNFLLIIYYFKSDRFALYDIIHDMHYVISMMTLYYVSVGQNWNHKSRR